MHILFCFKIIILYFYNFSIYFQLNQTSLLIIILSSFYDHWAYPFGLYQKSDKINFFKTIVKIHQFSLFQRKARSSILFYSLIILSNWFHSSEELYSKLMRWVRHSFRTTVSQIVYGRFDKSLSIAFNKTLLTKGMISHDPYWPYSSGT